MANMDLDKTSCETFLSKSVKRRTLQKHHQKTAPGSAGNSPNKKKNGLFKNPECNEAELDNPLQMTLSPEAFHLLEIFNIIQDI